MNKDTRRLVDDAVAALVDLALRHVRTENHSAAMAAVRAASVISCSGVVADVIEDQRRFGDISDDEADFLRAFVCKKNVPMCRFVVREAS